MYYPKYLVSESDRFNADNFPKVIEEIETISQATPSLSGFNVNMLISFLKDHCLDAAWVKNHPLTAGMISNRELVFGNTEALFKSGSGNRNFLAGLEEYIRRRCEP
jgi:hypothetical protein